ncbi:MAG: PorT family protein [Bacteroidales bacterium]|nr:PorT family protein [Bacteroidales bacterium]
MQDNWQEFDRTVRSALQDAEVKAPRRVWRAVSGRLDSARSAAAWWWWAVPAFAAAAVVLGLFLTGTFSANSPVSPAENIIVAQITEETQQQEMPAESLSGEFEAPAAAPATVARRARRTLLADASTLISTTPEPAEGSTVLPQEQEAGTPGTEPAPAVKDDSAEIAAQWAQIETQDAAAASRITVNGLYARGGVGGNDSNISYGGTGISHMAPGAGSPDAGITESGTSTYGIPFTVGLGARFNVTDRFSLGTGLDYSLLARTFKGTYSDSYTGSIFHAVQYVGIPVNAYYDLFSTKDNLLNVYAWGGGEAEVCVSNSYRLMSEPGSTVKDAAGAFQFSVALGMGVEIPISGKLSLYLDPAVRYYFHGNQPKSLRTDKPFMFNFDAGLRFNL